MGRSFVLLQRSVTSYVPLQTSPRHRNDVTTSLWRQWGPWHHCIVKVTAQWKENTSGNVGDDNWRTGTVSIFSHQFFFLGIQHEIKTVTWNTIFYPVPTTYVLLTEQHADIRMSRQPFCSLPFLRRDTTTKDCYMLLKYSVSTCWRDYVDMGLLRYNAV